MKTAYWIKSYSTDVYHKLLQSNVSVVTLSTKKNDNRPTEHIITCPINFKSCVIFHENKDRFIDFAIV